MKNYDSPVDALDDLRKRGYDVDFESQSNSLYGSNLDLRLNEEEFHVDEVHRLQEVYIQAIARSYMRSLLLPVVKGTIVDGPGASNYSPI